MKNFDRSPMLPLAATFAAVFLSACASSPTSMDLAAPAAKPAMADASVGETRNWASIDTNQDHLISPEEMTAYLDASRKAPTKP